MLKRVCRDIKALGDGENEADNFALYPIGKCALICTTASEVQRPITPIFIPVNSLKLDR